MFYSKSHEHSFLCFSCGQQWVKNVFARYLLRTQQLRKKYKFFIVYSLCQKPKSFLLCPAYSHIPEGLRWKCRRKCHYKPELNAWRLGSNCFLPPSQEPKIPLANALCSPPLRTKQPQNPHSVSHSLQKNKDSNPTNLQKGQYTPPHTTLPHFLYGR